MAGNDKKSKNFLVSKIGGQQLIVLGVIVALFAFFCIKSDIFRSYTTILSMLDFSYFVAFMAIGVTFALITGGNDLSIGTGMVCYGIIGGFFVTKLGLPVTVGFVITILCGVLMGCFNGFLVAILELPPFIATLSTMMIARGLGSIVTGGSSITWPADAWFKNIFKISIGEAKYPLGFVWVVVAVTIMTIFLRHTKPGRYIIAIGSNKEATRLSGVNVIKWHMLAYIICGMFTGFAGVAYSATFPTIAAGSGAGLELDAICAAIIGGTSMYGGSGTIFGTLLGVYVMSILKTGLPLIGLQANWQQIITGIVLLVAVFIDVVRGKKN